MLDNVISVIKKCGKAHATERSISLGIAGLDIYFAADAEQT
jgi:hypothetical protein